MDNQYGARLTRRFNRGTRQEETSAAGLVIGRAVYVQPLMTRYGEFPYPRYLRSDVRSVSNSVGNGIAMLWLAQKYGDHVFDLKIADYLDVTADHDGWEQVTLGDALNMAVGVGNGSHERYPLDIYADGDDDAFWRAGATQSKLRTIFSSENHPWGPGEVARYVNAHAFALSAAMDAYLKTQEGPDANLWDFVTEEVLEPIGVYHLPMLHTLDGGDGPGTPMMVLGLYPTVDDIAKITMLLQNGGRYGDLQLLSASRLDEALCRSGTCGLPTGLELDDGSQSYHMSFWGHAYRSTAGQYYQIPYMTGYGGNTVVLSPNGVSAFRFTDAKMFDPEPLIEATEAIRPFPEGQDQPLVIGTEAPQ